MMPSTTYFWVAISAIIKRDTANLIRELISNVIGLILLVCAGLQSVVIEVVYEVLILD